MEYNFSFYWIAENKDHGQDILQPGNLEHKDLRISVS